MLRGHRRGEKEVLVLNALYVSLAAVGRVYLSFKELIVGRHTVGVRAPTDTHTPLEIARAWAATSPKAWEYEVSAPSRCLLPVSAKLCRRNACSDRSLSRDREAFSRSRISTQHHNMHESVTGRRCAKERAVRL